MNAPNPYESTPLPCPMDRAATKQLSPHNWVIAGCLAGISIPLSLGIYGLYSESVYAATLPPGVGHCGMGSATAVAIMVFGSPFGGMVGGTVGWLASKSRR